MLRLRFYVYISVDLVKRGVHTLVCEIQGYTYDRHYYHHYLYVTCHQSYVKMLLCAAWFCGDYLHLQPVVIACTTASTLQKWGWVIRRRRVAAHVAG